MTLREFCLLIKNSILREMGFTVQDSSDVD